MLHKIKFLFKPYVSTLFLHDERVGVVLLALTFILPSVGFLGFIAILSTILFAEYLNIREKYLKYGFYLYNSMLVGMGVGYLYDITTATIIITIMLSIMTFLISFGLNRVLIKYSLPILSLPFAFVSMFFYLASLKYTNLLSNILHREPLFNLTLPCSPFFKSLGTIFFLPYDTVGLVISIVILLYSRILFLSAITGFLVGVLVHSFFISFDASLNSPYNFNFILIAMALSGVFLLAHIKNIILSIVGVILSVIMIDAMEVFFNIYSLPVYTLPFNIITILFVFLLFAINYEYFNFDVKESPEKSLSNYLSKIYRFGGNQIKINLPFTGTWSVYQAFNGKWTHKGAWRYAYDFVIKKDGKSYKNDGEFLEDYYAFGKPILAPISGYVISLRDDLEDNFIGTVDRLNNWGNYIIIQSVYGYFVEISHLKQNSLNLKVGDYVKMGQVIAQCGNSGYSPQPHIHIQVQWYSQIGSATTPFKFIDYIKGKSLIYYGLPKINQNIESVITDKAMSLRCTFILDEIYKYRVFNENKEIDLIEFKVGMNDKGEFFFTDGKNRLYFYLDEKLFYFYEYKGENSYLKELFKIVPKIPLINKNIRTCDVLPLELRYNKIKKMLLELLIPFNYKIFNKETIYEKEALTISSKYGTAQLSFYEKGFEIISFKNYQLKRVYEKDTNSY